MVEHSRRTLGALNDECPKREPCPCLLARRGNGTAVDVVPVAPWKPARSLILACDFLYPTPALGHLTGAAGPQKRATEKPEEAGHRVGEGLRTWPETRLQHPDRVASLHRRLPVGLA